MRWRTLLAAVVACALFGGAVGASGMFGRPDSPTPVIATVGAATVSVPAYDCPGGSVVASFSPGDRVFAIAHSAGGAWIALRAVASDYEQVWVPASAIESQPTIGLPTADCATPELTR